MNINAKGVNTRIYDEAVISSDHSTLAVEASLHMNVNLSSIADEYENRRA